MVKRDFVQLLSSVVVGIRALGVWRPGSSDRLNRVGDVEVRNQATCKSAWTVGLFGGDFKEIKGNGYLRQALHGEDMYVEFGPARTAWPRVYGSIIFSELDDHIPLVRVDFNDARYRVVGKGCYLRVSIWHENI